MVETNVTGQSSMYTLSTFGINSVMNRTSREGIPGVNTCPCMGISDTETDHGSDMDRLFSNRTIHNFSIGVSCQIGQATELLMA